MKLLQGGIRLRRAVALTALGLVLAGSAAVPVGAQDTLQEARVRRMEAEIRALQRKVFPGDGKFFAPEIAAAPGGAAAQSTGVQSTAVSTPATDMLARMEALEAQIKRLTAQSEENAHKIAQLEARVGGATAATAPAPAATPAATPAPAVTAADSNLSAMTGGASTPKPAPKPAPSPAASGSGPSAQRLAAVRAVVKPQTADAGDDEYSYGFRLWEAKFFPEAQQQLKMMVDKYPRHSRISYARNLLGRAYLDDGKPREAASWFLQNYQANKSGDRAADSLVMLAESMRQLKDSSRACIALAEFAETYPREAAGRLKSQYEATRGGVKCN